LDGTGRLFRWLLPYLPPEHHVQMVNYQGRTYQELVSEMVLPDAPVVLVAESFSGPLAIRLAELRPAHVVGVSLVASFVRDPRRLLTRFGAGLGSEIFRVRPPASVVRRFLLDDSCSDAQVVEVQETVHSVAPEVLAGRLREVARVDVSDAFRSLAAPVQVIAATRDRLVPPSATRNLQRLRLGLTAKWIDGPHLLLQSRPAEAAAIISRFVGSLR
jgi:pimeloyl-ACP methyl ester carboxylesterase